MVMLPENKAAAPAPATARPTMSISELVAAAQIIEPTADGSARLWISSFFDCNLPSKMTRALKYVHLTSKYVKTLPNEGWRELVVSR